MFFMLNGKGKTEVPVSPAGVTGGQTTLATAPGGAQKGPENAGGTATPGGTPNGGTTTANPPGGSKAPGGTSTPGTKTTDPGTPPAPTVDVSAELDRLRSLIENKAEAAVPEVSAALDRLAPVIKNPTDKVHASMIRGNVKALSGDFEGACKTFKGISAEAQKTRFKADLAKLLESCS
ncbi:MAG: hypothetical protein HY275_05720 [Gemmatimonadetes bacterium]|nr:hypothetical protein [Gemmatimonadota bacterium]